MIKQSYQEVSKEIIKEFSLHKKELTGKKIDYHNYFSKLQKKEPERFERLMFDTNGHKPFSGDLESILFDLKMCGILTSLGINDVLYLKKDLLEGYWKV